MTTSPVKFDDLAFILLFFFMMLVVISQISQTPVEVESQSEGFEEISQTVFLNSNGEFLMEDSVVELEYLQTLDNVMLECDDSLTWNEIKSSIATLDVTLVI